MSGLYFDVKRIINNENRRLFTLQWFHYLLFIDVATFGITGYVMYFNKKINILGVIILSICIVLYFGLLTFFQKNRSQDLKHFKKIELKIYEKFTSKGLNDLEIITLLQKEIAEECEKNQKRNKDLKSAIGKVFFFCFWSPMAFLLSIYINSNVTNETFENYIKLLAVLLELTVLIIGVIIAMHPFEILNSNRTHIKINSYLQNYRYHLMEVKQF